MQDLPYTVNCFASAIYAASSDVTLVWKVGAPSSRHQRRRGSRCWTWRHQEEWWMGEGHASPAD